MDFKFLREYNGYVILIWILLIAMAFLFVYTELPFWNAWIFIVSIAIPTYLFNSFLANYILPKTIKHNKTVIFSVIFLAVTFFMALIFVLLCHEFNMLADKGYFTKAEFLIEMTFNKGIATTFPTFILMNLSFCGLRLYEDHTKLQRLHLESQLQILQAQVNPHFMFNVLNHIHILIRKDVNKASFLLEKYSEILRYQLYNSNDKTSIGQEIKFLKDVISIERIRWGNDLQVETEWNIEDTDKKIYPLILSTFVENAFKHVSRSISDKGYVNIKLSQTRNNLVMTVKNSKWKSNVNEQKNLKKNSGLGIKNTTERLEILYPKRHCLTITETDSTFMVELQITLS